MRTSSCGALLVLAAVLLAGCGSSSQGQQTAATVNGKQISMATYDRQVTYKRVTTKSTTYGIDVCSVRTWAGLCRQLKRTVLDDLIKTELVRQWAAGHGVTVSQAELKRQWTIVFLGKFHGNRAALLAYLKANGITLNDLEGLVRDGILENEVMYRVTRRMPPYAPATRLGLILTSSQPEVSQIQAALRAGRPFNQLAAQLSAQKNSPCAQQGCGDQGWLPNALIPAAARAAATARPGSVVGPIGGQGGFSLFYVEAHAQRYLLDPRQDLNLREQVFADWVDQLQRSAKVQRFVSV